jgi:Methane oxygenase PmoA
MKKILLFLLIVPGYIHSQQSFLINFNAGKYQRDSTPVWVHLPSPAPAAKSWILIDQKTKRKIPAQLIDSITLVFIPKEKIPAGTKRTWLLTTVSSLQLKKPVKIQVQKDGLLVKVNNKPLLLYHTKEAMPPPDSPLYFRRSGFIHPLYSPSGKILTDDFPVAHIHQHGIFMTWPNTLFRKELLDFWNQQLQTGTVEHVEILKITQGSVVSQLRLKLRHKSLKYGEVISEIWTLTIYPFTEHFLFDLESEQVNTTTDTLFVNTNHYGGLAFRGSKQWNPDDTVNFKKPWQILTSEGIKDTLANATHARWVDASGEVDGEMNGVTIFNHSSNFRYPQGLRVHPSMPYWAYAPAVDGTFTLNPGVAYHSRFRYLVHRGKPDTNLIEKLRRDWEEPPIVRVSLK